MSRQHYFTTRNQRQARQALINVLGAVILVSSGVALMLAYFDVLVK